MAKSGFFLRMLLVQVLLHQSELNFVRIASNTVSALNNDDVEGMLTRVENDEFCLNSAPAGPHMSTLRV